jgi:signal transduction histidine kinase/FixJ family two-component response regulator
MCIGESSPLGPSQRSPRHAAEVNAPLARILLCKGGGAVRRDNGLAEFGDTGGPWEALCLRPGQTDGDTVSFVMQTLMETSLARRSLRPLALILVEDNTSEADLILGELRKAGFDVRSEILETAQCLFARIMDRDCDLIVVDTDVSDQDGPEVLEVLQHMERETPVILLSERLDGRQVRQALQKGAADFVEKGCLARLPVVVERLMVMKALRVELAQAEVALQKSAAEQQRVAELCPEPLLIVSADHVVFANSAAMRLLNAESREELLGRPVTALWHAGCRANVKARMDALNETDESADFRVKLARPNGRSFEMQVTATALHFRERPAIQIVFREAVKSPGGKEPARSLSAYAELNPNPVLEFSHSGQLTYFNQAATEMAQALGFAHARDFLPERTPSFVKFCLTTGMKKAPFETKVADRTLLWSFYPIKQHHVVHCCITDVTDRIQLEAQLRHAQKMESVGRLAAGVAHDFNNVLTVIQGHSGLLRAHPQLPAEAAESLQAISRAADRAAKLTSQLLLFSRRSHWQPKAVDLNEMLTQMSTMLQRTLGEDVQVQFGYEPGLAPILADVTLIEQVVMSLAVNARDAMPKGGTLLINTARADIDDVYVERHPEARPGSFICLSMIDTGCGMDHLTLSRIFEPFFTTKEFGKGTGLGLATVYGIVKQHQGWIEVQSQVGQGTTFRIYLPPSQSLPDHRPDTGTHVGIRGGNETILVVEDEPPVRWTVRNVLERYGYRVLEASAGVEALAIWHQHHQDIRLLLTDMVMPAGLTGQDLAEKFKHQKPDLKVVYISGYSVHTADRGPEFVDGLNFLQKPFDADALARAVRKCLDADQPAEAPVSA